MSDEMNEAKKLDDATRVKVMSPGMLVAKRFFRNKLAIVGLVILVCMFLFAFLGGVVIPYSETDVFYTTDVLRKDFAGCAYITDFEYVQKPGAKVPSDLQSKFIRALMGKPVQTEFTTRDGTSIVLESPAENMYIAYCSDGGKLSELAFFCKYAFSAYTDDVNFSYDFQKEALTALGLGNSSFSADGVSYMIDASGENAAMIKTSAGANFAYVSNLKINCVISGLFITPDFKEKATIAIADGAESFEYTDDEGVTDTYLIFNKNGEYTIQRYQETRVMDTYASPSKEHPVGTASNGMDLLARLMFGGRVSLTIGFIVVIIELLIGVVIGGFSGYFGGWIDTILMRVVDIIYCIPSLPLYLILGSIMDYLKASSGVRMFALCCVLGLLGWVGIARIVRGQILSFREQEFMTAAEATGISVRRRVFKHLIPNVVPQLVVYASMDIGAIILVESTLSFLGLGIKYPSASWGSIINAVTDPYIMANYPFVWVPAGCLILLTVLAFNFIGDGLRDAFDPKMKR
jgi:peptide/nickel transport system permease protein